MSHLGQKPESKLAAQAARTRARLIEATLELLPKHGFRKLSLDAIAAHVGMTKGAIYASFPSKDALIMAALGSRPESRPDLSGMNWPKGREGTVKERLHKLGLAVLEAMATAGPVAGASLELVALALSSEPVREHVASLRTRSLENMRQHVLDLFAPEELPMPVEAFALLLASLIPSLMYNRLLQGDGLHDDTVLAMFEGLAGRD